MTDQVYQRIQALNDIALKRGQTLTEMALAWVLKDQYVSSVIIGASSVEQMKNNLKAIQNTNFTSDELTAIDHICNSKD